MNFNRKMNNLKLNNVEFENRALMNEEKVYVLKSEVEAKDSLLIELRDQLEQITREKDIEVYRLSLKNKNSQIYEDRIKVLQGNGLRCEVFQIETVIWRARGIFLRRLLKEMK